MWQRHCVPVVFVVGLSENHTTAGLALRDGSAILRQALRAHNVTPAIPILRQLNVDWSDALRKGAGEAIVGVTIVSDLGHCFTDIEKQSKKLALGRKPTHLKRILKRYNFVPTHSIYATAVDVQLERIAIGWQSPKYAEYLRAEKFPKRDVHIACLDGPERGARAMMTTSAMYSGLASDV